MNYAPPLPLGVYRHYKGNEYEVIGFAKHSETLEELVVYRVLYGERVTWVRPLSMWETAVEADGKTVKRFEYVGSNDEAEQKYALIEAHRALLSTLSKCEKMDMDKLGKAQRTLLGRRIAALKIALDLIEKESGPHA